MANLLTTLFRRPADDEITRYTLSDYLQARVQAVQSLSFPGFSSTGTIGGRPVEQLENSYTGYASGAYKTNSVVAACMRVRRDLFSQAAFCWREMTSNGPGRTFRDDTLAVLERPWPNGTTGELLTRMITDVDLCGNSYIANEGDRLRWLRPDWVSIVLTGDPQVDADVDVFGYIYTPGGQDLENGVPYTPDRICHFSPLPDPLAQYRGQTWLTPAIRDIQADTAATEHKLAFFTNGATLGPIIRVPAGVTQDQFKQLVADADAAHVGSHNAYRPFYVGGGVDVTLAGASMAQLEFRATQGAGEPLALDTPIPTPTGWTTMGEIQVADQVIGRDGQPANVVGVSPVHEGRECFRITLKDRTSLVADAGHPWVAIDRNSARRNERIYTTRELYDLFIKPFPNGVGGNRLSLPASPIVAGVVRDLLVDPYVLGAWLGDGQTAGPAICGAEDDLKWIVAEIEERGYVTRPWKVTEGKASIVGIPGGLLVALRALGVLGNKRIPDEYLHASVDQRLDLLRGLMDTDGTVSVLGHCEFSSKYEHLGRQVAELARSLGYRATLSSKADARSRTGEHWRVSFRVCLDRIPFLLPRKVDRCVEAGEAHVGSAKSIISIEPVESVPVRCIAVDTADHLFLAGEGFVPTHNTRVAALAGVHPVLVGLSEGLAGSSLNAGNFAAARRATADITLWKLWIDVCRALSAFVEDPPPDAQLWVDERQVPFLREDARDQAEITKTKILSIESGIRAGFKPDPLVVTVDTNDVTALSGAHSNLFSVQLQPAGATSPAAPPELDLTRPQEALARAYLARHAIAATAYELDDDWYPAEVLGNGRHRHDDDFEIVEVDRAGYRPGQARFGKGVYLGKIPIAGRWRLLGGHGGAKKILEALDAWARGDEDSPDDPLQGFTVPKLREAAHDMGLAGHGDRHELTGRILDDVRKKVRGHRQALRDLPRYSYGTGVDRPQARDQAGKLHDIEIYQSPGGLSIRLLDQENRGQEVVATGLTNWLAVYRWARKRKLANLAGWVEKYHPVTRTGAQRRRRRLDALVRTLRGYDTYAQAELLLHGVEPAEVADLYRHLGGKLDLLPRAPTGRIPNQAVIEAVMAGWPRYTSAGTLDVPGNPLAPAAAGSTPEVPDVSEGSVYGSPSDFGAGTWGDAGFSVGGEAVPLEQLL